MPLQEVAPLPSKYPDMPRFYVMKVRYANGEVVDYELASHTIVDKVLDLVYDEQGRQVFFPVLDAEGSPVLKDGKPVADLNRPQMRIVGPSPSPYFECWLTSNKVVTIPMHGVSAAFDENWTKICDIRKREREGK